MLQCMRVISYVLEATIALVFIFGVLGALLTGSRNGSRSRLRRFATQSVGLAGAQAWVSGFGGSMGRDGAAPRAAEEA
jgi:hypothetical protein